MNIYIGILVGTLSAMGLVVFFVLVSELIGRRTAVIVDGDRLGRALIENRIHPRDYMPSNYHRVRVPTDHSGAYTTEFL
jgi:hypothetical protein